MAGNFHSAKSAIVKRQMNNQITICEFNKYYVRNQIVFTPISKMKLERTMEIIVDVAKK